MRCNKCGEEYKDNQAFCLKCGNPIHVVPDFNLIEAGLANDVGALMDGDENECSFTAGIGNADEFGNAEPMKTVNVPVDDISMELKMVDINRGRFNFEEDDFTLIDEEEEEEEFRQRRNSNRPVRRPEQSSNLPKNTRNPRENQKAKNNKKAYAKNILIMLGCILAVTFVIVILWKVVFSEGLNESGNFTAQYNIAKEQYDKNNKKEAIEEAKKTVKIAYNSTQVIKARKLLHDVYVHFEVFDKDYQENLMKIVELEPANNKYNEALLDYYYTGKMYMEFNEFFATLEGKGTTENMTKYLPAKPVITPEAGHYDTFLNVEITVAEGTKVYYTLDGKEPKNNENAFEYTEPIKLTSEETFVVMAYVKDANGIMSETSKVEYIIDDVEVSGPVVTPSSGAYSDYQKITVTIPEGAKVYYTTDGTEPTSASTVYTEPFDMPYGRSDYKFVCIDANGNESNITSVTYSLALPRNVDTRGAQTLVKDKCIKDKELDENAKDKNGLEYTFNYKDMVIIENAEYYIIEVSVTNESKEVEYYAVHTNETTVMSATSTEDGYELVVSEEE